MSIPMRLALSAALAFPALAIGGSFDPAQWTLAEVADTSDQVQLDIGSTLTMAGPLAVWGYGSLTQDLMTLRSGNAGVKGVTRFEAVAAVGGTVSIDWTYQSFDMPCYDNGGYFVNDTMTIIACNRGPDVGHAEFDVADGQLFGLAVRTGDGLESSGTLKIVTFAFTGVIDGGDCIPDFDASGTLDLFDFLAFTNAFNAGDPRADLTGDGLFDLFDFLAFVNAFNTGC